MNMNIISIFLLSSFVLAVTKGTASNTIFQKFISSCISNLIIHDQLDFNHVFASLHVNDCVERGLQHQMSCRNRKI